MFLKESGEGERKGSVAPASRFRGKDEVTCFVCIWVYMKWEGNLMRHNERTEKKKGFGKGRREKKNESDDEY